MQSIRRQLTLGLLLTFALLLGVGGTLVHLAAKHTLYEQFNDLLRVKALAVISDSHVDDERVRIRFSDRFLDEFDDDVSTAYFQVREVNGRTAARSDSLGRQDLPLQHGTMEDPVFWNLDLPDGSPGRAIGIQFTAPGEQRHDSPREAVVVVAAQRTKLDHTVSRLRNILLGSGVILLVLTAAVVPGLMKRGLRPLDHVADRAAKIDADSLQTRFPVDTMPAELRPICGRLNALLGRLEDSFERERRFSSDIAHELRTPLAELRSLAELSLKWPENDAGANYRQVLEISLQMEALVTRLLALGRAEQGGEPLRCESIQIEPLVRQLTEPLLANAARRRIALTPSIPSDAEIVTDRLLLQIILTNLLENAIHYSRAESTISVDFVLSDDQFELAIGNDPEDLQPADLPRMFERFWRKDAARTESENSGLGLSLSRTYARLLGCQLGAVLQEDGRLVMRLSGPVAPPDTTGPSV